MVNSKDVYCTGHGFTTEGDREEAMKDGGVSVLERISTFTTECIENFFYRLGLHIGKKPYHVVYLILIIAPLCTIGVTKFKADSRTLHNWMPSGTDVKQNATFVKEHFRSTVRHCGVFFDSFENILEIDRMKQIIKFDEDARNIRGEEYSWETLCNRDAAGNCLYYGIVRLWPSGAPGTTAQVLERINLVDKLNNSDAKRVLHLLGDVERDNDGEIVSAKSALLMYELEDRSKPVEIEQGSLSLDIISNEWEYPNGEEWEIQFETLAENFTSEDLYVNVSTQHLLDTTLGVALKEDMMFMLAGYSLVLLYLIFALGDFTLIEHKVVVGLAGLTCIGLSLITGFGIASVMGIDFGPVNQVLYFLVLGIGVDDMFVVVQCLKNLSEEERSLPVPERTGMVMKHAGTSIAITTITDVMAFAIGATTVIHALRSFCLFASVCLLTLFVIQCTLFVAVLSLDMRRVDGRRDACLCCIRHARASTSATSPPPSLLLLSRLHSHVKGLQLHLYRGLQLITSRTDVKVPIITAAFCGVALCAWRAALLEADFSPLKNIPPASMLYTYIPAVAEKFPEVAAADELGVYATEEDYYRKQDVLRALYSDIVGSEYSKETRSWYDGYEQWAASNKTCRHTIRTPPLDASSASHTEMMFYSCLRYYIYSVPDGRRYSSDVQFRNGHPHDLIVSRMYVTTSLTFTTPEGRKTENVENFNRMVEEYRVELPTLFAYGWSWFEWVSREAIEMELIRNLAISFSCVFAIVLVMIVNLRTTVLVLTTVIATMTVVIGLLQTWGTTFDGTLSSQLTVSLGLSVDFSSHIGFTFMTIKGNKIDRALATIIQIGPAVFNGAFSTLLAFCFLSFGQTYQFQTFFRLFFLLTTSGVTFGVLFLPLLLSIFGPEPYRGASTDAGAVIAKALLRPDTAPGPLHQTGGKLQNTSWQCKVGVAAEGGERHCGAAAQGVPVCVHDGRGDFIPRPFYITLPVGDVTAAVPARVKMPYSGS